MPLALAAVKMARATSACVKRTTTRAPEATSCSMMPPVAVSCVPVKLRSKRRSASTSTSFVDADVLKAAMPPAPYASIVASVATRVQPSRWRTMPARAELCIVSTTAVRMK
jgi:hypothetical protein